MLDRYLWDLMFCGHTRGGQAPVEDKRYVTGLNRWGSRQIHITRGVGNVGGVRFGGRPEVSLLTLTGPHDLKLR